MNWAMNWAGIYMRLMLHDWLVKEIYKTVVFSVAREVPTD